MPEDESPSGPCAPPNPPAPKYTPSRRLYRNTPLTAEDLISYYQDFYDTLKISPSAPSIVFERLASNLIDSLTAPPTQDPIHGNCVAALEKCRDEKGVLSLELKKSQKDLETSQTKLTKSQEDLATAQRDLATAQRDLATAQRDLAMSKSQHASVVETRLDIGDFHSPGGVPKDIVFLKPYSAPPVISVGIRGIHTTANTLRSNTYATNIRTDGFRIHYGEKDNTVHSSWLLVPTDYPDIQCGTISAKGGDSVLDNAIKVTFPRPFKESPKVETYFSEFDFSSNSSWYLTMSQSNETPTGFTLKINGASLRKCTVSWIAYPKETPRIWSHSEGHTIGGKTNFSGYSPFGSKLFTNPPRVMLAIRGIYMPSASNGIKVMLDSSKDDVDGVHWEVGASDGVELFSLWVCFIALG